MTTEGKAIFINYNFSCCSPNFCYHYHEFIISSTLRKSSAWTIPCWTSQNKTTDIKNRRYVQSLLTIPYFCFLLLSRFLLIYSCNDLVLILLLFFPDPEPKLMKKWILNTYNDNTFEKFVNILFLIWLNFKIYLNSHIFALLPRHWNVDI